MDFHVEESPSTRYLDIRNLILTDGIRNNPSFVSSSYSGTGLCNASLFHSPPNMEGVGGWGGEGEREMYDAEPTSEGAE